ncbi:MAG: methyl-accepting chemotaxis protein [Brevinematales bacterium]|nr:methyl-accepting chemotaxis protein [Brevinematales bacterium]
MLKNMSLTAKLMTGFIVVAILTGGVGALGWIGISSLSNEIASLGKKSIPSIANLYQVETGQLEIKVAVRTLISGYISDEDIKRQYTNVAIARTAYNYALSNYILLAHTEEEKQLFDSFMEKLKEEAVVNNEYFALVNDLHYVQNIDKQEISIRLAEAALKGNIQTVFNEALARLDKLIEYVMDYYGVQEVNHSISIADTLNIVIISAAAGGFILALILGIVLSSSISKPVNVITSDLFSSAGSLESAAGQVSSSSQELSSGASELASSVEEMTSSLEELQSIIESNTKNITQGSGMIGGAYKGAADSVKLMQDLSEAHEEIDQNSQKVAKVIKVIDDIAFQTNILALNAAVEAARAGDAGRGFAVVADQVKSLAQKSADAAKETAQLIENAINSVKTGKDMGAKVLENANASGELMEKVKTIMDEINKASQEQLKGANQVTKAVSQINTVVQQTASTSEETAAAGEELLSQSEVLNEVVEKLNAIVRGAGQAQTLAAEARAKKAKHQEHKIHLIEHKRDENPAEAKKAVQLSHKDEGVDIIRPEDKIPMDDFKDF